MNQGTAGFILGAALMGMLFSVITSTKYIHSDTIVKHQNCAYYHPVTGKLTWLDEGKKDGDK